MSPDWPPWPLGRALRRRYDAAMWSSSTLELAAPALLVAMPHLKDGPFAQAVVLLVQHDAQGSMGLMLNQPTGVTLGDFGNSLGVDFGARGAEEVYMGGPVENERAFILHDGPHRGPETTAVLPQVAMSFSMESLGALAKHPPQDLRVCIGYAGWGAQQLAQEIAQGAWMVATPEPHFLFHTPPEQMWHAALKEMGIEPLQLMQKPTALN